MATSTPTTGHDSGNGNGDANHPQLSSMNPSDKEAVALTAALSLAQRELQDTHASLEQLLDVLRNADRKQLESLVAAIRSGLPQPEIIAMIKQYTKDIGESTAPK